MNTCKNVFAYHTFVQHDGVLIIVSLPRHICHQKVLTQSQFSVLCTISFCQDLTRNNSVSLIDDGTEVDGHVLIGTTELGYAVFFKRGFKTYKLFIFSAVIQNADGCCINVFNNTITFGCNHGTAVLTNLTFDTCTNNRSF